MLDGLLGKGTSAKCKSAIKLINKRLELIKRKRNSTLRFLRQDVVDLLGAGHEKRAFDRAEGVINELNTSSCYDLIEYFCTCILNNVSSIHKQREIPADVIEAMATLSFAAARFADLPELSTLRKVFTERYGDALSVESSVSPEFAGKVSSEPPTTQKKLGLLRQIAKEASIRWDSKAFEETLNNPSAAANKHTPKHSASLNGGHYGRENNENGANKEALSHARSEPPLRSVVDDKYNEGGFESLSHRKCESGKVWDETEARISNIRAHPPKNEEASRTAVPLDRTNKHKHKFNENDEMQAVSPPKSKTQPAHPVQEVDQEETSYRWGNRNTMSRRSKYPLDYRSNENKQDAGNDDQDPLSYRAEPIPTINKRSDKRHDEVSHQRDGTDVSLSRGSENHHGYRRTTDHNGDDMVQKRGYDRQLDHGHEVGADTNGYDQTTRGDYHDRSSHRKSKPPAVYPHEPETHSLKPDNLHEAEDRNRKETHSVKSRNLIPPYVISDGRRYPTRVVPESGESDHNEDTDAPVEDDHFSARKYQGQSHANREALAEKPKRFEQHRNVTYTDVDVSIPAEDAGYVTRHRSHGNRPERGNKYEQHRDLKYQHDDHDENVNVPADDGYATIYQSRSNRQMLRPERSEQPRDVKYQHDDYHDADEKPKSVRNRRMQQYANGEPNGRTRDVDGRTHDDPADYVNPKLRQGDRDVLLEKHYFGTRNKGMAETSVERANGHYYAGGNEKDEIQPRHHQGRTGRYKEGVSLEDENGRGVPPRRQRRAVDYTPNHVYDDEEAMDELLFQYCRKQPPQQATSNTINPSLKPPPGRSAAAVGNMALRKKDELLQQQQQLSHGEPGPNRTSSLPAQQSKADVAKGPVRAASMQPEMLSGNGHVHPKLPDYDDLAARFMAMRRVSVD